MKDASTGLVLKPETKAVDFAVAPALATGRVRRGGHRSVMLEQNLGVILLAATQRTPDSVEPEQLRGLNRLCGEILVFKGASPVRDGVGQ